AVAEVVHKKTQNRDNNKREQHDHNGGRARPRLGCVYRLPLFNFDHDHNLNLIALSGDGLSYQRFLREDQAPAITSITNMAFLLPTQESPRTLWQCPYVPANLCGPAASAIGTSGGDCIWAFWDSYSS